MAILILLSIGAVSAADNATADAVSATNQEVLSADSSDFNQLQDIINGHTGTDPLILDKNYTYSGAEYEPKVVTIINPITIEGSPGKNITLNANNIAEVGIFEVDADGVVLNNINFIKATNHAVIVNGERCVINNSHFYNNIYNSRDMHANGPAVYWDGTDGTIDNSVFENNHISERESNHYDSGGAVCWMADNGVIKNSNFTNNAAFNGGAITWGRTNGEDGCPIVKPKKGTIDNCIFIGNYVDKSPGASGNTYWAGAVHWFGPDGTIKHSLFDHNRGGWTGAIKVDDDAVNMKIFDCNFTFNEAYDPNEGSAGAVEMMAYNGTIYDCNFINNTAETAAGALKMNDGATYSRVYNCNFTNNTAKHTFHGGAIEWLAHNCNLTDSNFINNSAPDAGAIQWSGENGKVLNCNFTINTADGVAGAIRWDGEFGNVSYSNFTENYAYYGGAISWKGNNGDLSNSIFIKNNAEDGEGGAVFYYYDIYQVGDDSVENATMSNCNFTDNTAGYGGAISWNGLNGTFSNSNFINNTASENGGAIGSWGSDLNIIDNCNFTSNKAADCGGAIFIDDDGNDNYVSDNYFLKNNAPNGGAVYWNAESGSLTDSYFIGNNATEEGGAVYWQGKSGTLTDSNFTSNNATENGGAVYWNGESGTLSGSDFKDNKATENGGAVYWNGSPGTLSSSNFTDNKATENGGAIYINFKGDYVECKIDGSNFTSNSAKQGGAVYLLSNNPISRSTFTGNKATEKGGAIYNCDDGSKITESNFTSNTANDGGAVYCGADWNGYIYGSSTITFANFINNTAKQNGGAIYYLAKGQTLENANFTGNTAVLGGAIFAEANDVSIDVAYFNNNNATNGSAIYKTAEANEFKISNTLFERNQAHSKEITIDVEGNKTYALADVTVKISLVANDNIANAIWNDGGLDTIVLKNIQCEFSLDSQGRELKQFNVGDYYAPTGDSYDGDDKLWQNPLEDAQLIDIIIKNQNNVTIYNVTAGTVEESTRKGILQALPDDRGLTVTKTDGSITIKFENLEAGKYSVDAVHKEDAYYKEVANSDSFVIYNLTVNKTTDDVLVAVGQNVTYTITLYNDGDKNISNIVVKELLPKDCFELLNYSTAWFGYPSGAEDIPGYLGNWSVTADGFSIVNNRDSLNSVIGPHESVVLTLVYKATKEGKYKNLIEVYADSLDVIKVNSDNETVVVPVRLNVTKQANATKVANNSLVNYTILVNNTSIVNITVFNLTVSGDDIIYSVKDSDVTDIKINGTNSFIVYGVNASSTVNRNEVIFTAGSGYSLSYLVIYEDGTNITYFSDNEVRYVFNNVQITADDIVTAYETYTIDATNVTVVDKLPEGLDYVSATNATGVCLKLSDDSKTLTWTIDNLTDYIRLNVIANVNTAVAGKNLTNNVTANCNENKTPVSDNATVTVMPVILDVTKIADLDIVPNSSLVNYTITVKNTGMFNATKVSIVDTLPDNLTYVKGNWGIIEANGADIREISDLIWEVSNIINGSYVSIWLAVTVNTSEIGNITNVVSVNSKENKTNVTDNETIEVVPIKLNVTKVVQKPVEEENSVFINGSEITFIICISNICDVLVYNATVVDELPEGLVYKGYDVGDQSRIIGFENIDNKTVTLIIDCLDIDEKMYIWITAQAIKSGNLTNNVTVNCNENKTPVTDNATVEIVPVVLEINKTANVAVVGNNSLVNYTITVKNTIKHDLTDLVICDELPVGLIFVEDATSGWSYNPSTRVISWNLTELDAGDIHEYYVVVRTNGTGVMTNKVNVTCVENRTEVKNTTNITVEPVNLTIVKTATPGEVFIDENVTFTITVTNLGKVKSTDINITDILYEAFAFDGVSANGTFKYDDKYRTIVWNIAELASGSSISVCYNVTVLENGTLPNVATVVCKENTTEVSNETNVTVNLYPSLVNGENVTYPYGTPIKVDYNSTNATGVIYEIYDKDGKMVDNGTVGPNGTIDVKLLPVGNYTVYWNNTVDSKHTPATNTSNIEITPLPSAVEGVDVIVPYGTPIEVDYNSTNATGVTYEIYDKDGKLVDNGTVGPNGTIDVKQLPVGNYTVNWTTVVDSNHINATNSSTIEVLPIPTTTTVGNATGYPGEEVTIPVNVTAEDGNPINGNVTITLPDGTNKTVEIINGTGTTTWTIPDDYVPGDYPDNASYPGNETYLPSKGTGVVTVLPIPTNTTVGNVTGYPGDEVTIPVNVTADDDKPFNGNVTITLPDGSNKTVEIVNGTGNTTWTIPDDYVPGTYPDNATFPGNDQYLPSNGTGVVEVLPLIPTNTTVGNVTGYPGQEVTIPVNVTADDGKPFTGNITFTYPDGTTSTVEIINGTGTTTWTIPDDYVPGDYPDNATYPGDKPYLPSNGTGVVTVLLIPTEVTIGNVTAYPGENVTIPINVTTLDGVPFNGDVAVVMPDNSTQIVSIENGTGIITWHVPEDYTPDKYPDTIRFPGTEKYAPSNGTGIIEVVKIPTHITVGNVTTFAGREVTIPINVTADDGKPFNGNVTITLPDGTTKTVEIINGQGSTTWFVPYDYTPDKYPDTVKFAGDNKYLPSEGKGTITVIKIPVDIIVGNVTVHPGEKVVIPIKVIPRDGSVFNGKITVELPDGTLQTIEIINGKGNVHWTVPEDYKPGDYLVKAHSDETNIYYPANGTGIITVIVEPPVPDDGNKTHKDIPAKKDLPKDSLAKYETGNPIMALLAVLALLGVGIKRRK